MLHDIVRMDLPVTCLSIELVFLKKTEKRMLAYMMLFLNVDAHIVIAMGKDQMEAKALFIF